MKADDREHGMLLPPDDAASVPGAISSPLLRADDAAVLGTKLRERVLREFGWERHPYRLIFVCALAVIAFAGIRQGDFLLPSYFQAFYHGAPAALDPANGYLLEGLLQDAIGLAFGALPLSPALIGLAWVLVGCICLALALAWSVADGSVSPATLLLVVAFSRVPDTLSLWIGKMDPFLFAFLVLSVNRDRAVATTGTILAAFCHPIAAVVSSVGVACVQAATGRAVCLLGLAATIAAAQIDLLGFRLLFPELTGRPGYFAGNLVPLVVTGLHLAPLNLVAAFAAPLLAIRCLAGPIVLTRSLPALLLIGWLLGVIVLSSLLTFDHTRVAAIVTLAPLIAFLQANLAGADRLPRWRGDKLLFLALLTARLMIPHIDHFGLRILGWSSSTIATAEAYLHALGLITAQ